MLVAAFEIEIGRRAQFRPLLADRGMADPGIEPDIEDILFLDEIARAAVAAVRASGSRKSSIS